MVNFVSPVLLTSVIISKLMFLWSGSGLGSTWHVRVKSYGRDYFEERKGRVLSERVGDVHINFM